MFKIIIKRLIKIYTPFICAVIAIVHGVMFLFKYKTTLYYLFSDWTGHSVLLLAYVWATSTRMCLWYKLTVYVLMLTHVVNTLYYYSIIDSSNMIYYGLVLNIFALLTFLIYRVSVGITKFLC